MSVSLLSPSASSRHLQHTRARGELHWNVALAHEHQMILQFIMFSFHELTFTDWMNERKKRKSVAGFEECRSMLNWENCQRHWSNEASPSTVEGNERKKH